MRVLALAFSIVAALAARAIADPPDAPPTPPAANPTPTPPSTAAPAPPAELDPNAAPPADATPTPRRPIPTTAVAALDRAAAAYEYGDMNLVVESARLVVDGGVTSTAPERADALRFLGVGLYLTGRVEGARVAFVELLRLLPGTRLDATITRPEVVAFFNEQKRAFSREADEARRRDFAARQPHVAWNLLPPVGQFHNDDAVKGWILLGIEALTLGTAVATAAVLNSWHNSNGDTVCRASDPNCDRIATARTLRSLNHASVGLLALSYAVGVLDGFVRHARVREQIGREAAVSLTVLPNALFVGGRF